MRRLRFAVPAGLLLVVLTIATPMVADRWLNGHAASGADDPAGATSGTAIGATAGRQAAAAAPVADLRPQLRAAVTVALTQQRTAAELDAFLAELEARARRQGAVTVLEIEPGVAAIEKVYPADPAREMAFTSRMERLGRQLAGTPEAASAEAAQATVGALLRSIDRAPAGPERDTLLGKAVEAIGTLPLDDQTAALAALERATKPPPAVVANAAR